MLGKCVHVSKNVETLGIRAQVEGLFANQQDVLCGVVGPNTKIIVRSRSGRLFWLVQMSTEMWEFAPDGELYYEKLLNRLLRVLVSKWSENSVTHSVTIIAFSRSFYDKEQFPDDYDPKSTLFSSPSRQGFGPGCTANRCANGYGPTIHVDPLTGQYYEDFYKVLVMNYTGPDWSELLLILKREFMNYHETHRWRLPSEPIPCEYEVCRDAEATSSTSTVSPLTPSETQSSTQASSYVKWKVLPFGVPSRAADGNVLEAINVTLNILDKHYMDRDLNRTGQSIVMLTAGSSVFKVDERLAEITKQRMMDNGVGMDMISLATPPLHVAPLFICRHRSSFENEDVGTRTIDSVEQLSTSATPNGLDGVLTPTYLVRVDG
ncbi:hypothetical protein PINS_up009510 [Pythium insidiosum]|nr:hypothetical protein PINS_up009510 [Pythium insidiosum]